MTGQGKERHLRKAVEKPNADHGPSLIQLHEHLGTGGPATAVERQYRKEMIQRRSRKGSD